MSNFRRALFAVVVVAHALLGTSTVMAQETTGNIEGRVLDDAGAPVPFATVAVSGPSLIGNRGAISTKDGFFRIPELAPGTYTVKVSHVSYQALTIAEVVVYLGRTTTLRPEVKAAIYEVEPIVVRGRKPLLDFSETETSSNLTSAMLAQLPTPRDYRAVISYVPQANTSYLGDNTNVAGSTGSENQYFIEGVNVTDPFLASSGMRLPQNFVREVQVKEGGYEAEYGKSTGGIINVITHSGSNDFKGQGFGFLTNNNVASDSRRGIGEFKQQDFARYDIGTSLGGAIIRDKLWYFAAYNPTFERENLQIPGLDFYQDKMVSQLFAGKLTWSPDPNTKVDATVFGDPTHRDKIGGDILNAPMATELNADPMLTEQTTGSIAAKVSGRRLFGERAILEASVSRVEASNEQRPATEIGRTEVRYRDLTTSTGSGGWPMEFDHHTVRWNGDVSTTVFAGSHEFKLGAAYEDIALDETWTAVTPDGRPGVVYRLEDGLWQAVDLWNVFAISHRLPSAYLQDAWRVTSGLRVNAGVRWDGIYIINPDGEVAQSITDGYQPRAGFTFQLDKSARQKLSGSYGRFYEQIPMIASSWFFGKYLQKVAFYDVNPLPDFTPPPIPGGYELNNSNYLSVDNLGGQYLDEFTLGYERLVGATWKAGVRGIYRNLGQNIEDTVLLDSLPKLVVLLGNAGKGPMSNLPDPKRTYKALEFSLENTFGRNLYLMLSYVWSETRGNYPGVYNTDGGNPHAHTSDQVLVLEQISEGLLPNDRTHVFKMYGSYTFDFGLTTGGFFTWQSGTPLSEYGGTIFGPAVYSHLVPRGTAGRTPSIWDANLRLSYDLTPAAWGLRDTRTRMLVDVFHLFGQRKPTYIDQVHYFGGPVEDPSRYGLNPNYGRALAYQPPMTVRVGIEASF